MGVQDELERLARERGGKVLGVDLPSPEAETPKKSKYGNVRCEFDGYKFDSKAEMVHYHVLVAREKAEQILGFQVHPRFRLGCAENYYEADFIVWRPDCTTYVVDVKGHRTAKFERDVKLWKRFGPCDLHIIQGGEVEVVRGRW